MPVEMNRIARVFGDRALVRRLSSPEKRGGLFLPVTNANKPKQQEIWFGVIEHLGSDMRYPDAYGVKVGDLVGVEFTGSHCETFTGDDKHTHVWVAEEFLAVKDSGYIEAELNGKKWSGNIDALIPLGNYVLAQADEEQDTRNGIAIPESARELQRTGEVLAVSAGEVRGSELYPLSIAPKATILFGRYSGQKMALADKEFLLMKQEDIIAEMAKAPEVAHA